MTLHEAIARAIEITGTSQSELARRLSPKMPNSPAVNRLVTGKKDFRASTLARIAAALGVEFVVRGPGDVSVRKHREVGGRKSDR